MTQDFDPRELEPAQSAEPIGGFRFAPLIVALAALAGFAGIVWYAYSQGAKQGASDVTVIKADQSPTKIKPDQPGGLNVPHQDSAVLNEVIGGKANSAAPGADHILPPPEQPLPKPVPQNATLAKARPVITGAEAPVPKSAPRGVVETQRLANTAVATPSAPTQIAAIPTPPVATAVQTPVTPNPAIPNAITPKPPAVNTPVANAPVVKTTSATPVSAPATSPAPVVQAQRKNAAVSPAVAKPQPPVTTAAAPQGHYRVQVAAVHTDAEAETEWQHIKSQFSQFGNLQLTKVKIDVPGKGSFIRIQAGPLADVAAAESLCQNLHQQNQACLVIRQ